METIRRCRPNLIVEIEERMNPGAIGRVSAKLGAWGYQASFFEKGQRKNVEDFEPLHHQPAGLVFDKVNDIRRTFPWVKYLVFIPQP